MLESYRKFSLNQPFLNALTNGMNKHQDTMHNIKELEKSLDDAEELLATINQRKCSCHDIPLQLEIQMQWRLTKWPSKKEKDT